MPFLNCLIKGKKGVGKVGSWVHQGKEYSREEAKKNSSRSNGSRENRSAFRRKRDSFIQRILMTEI